LIIANSPSLINCLSQHIMELLPFDSSHLHLPLFEIERYRYINSFLNL